MAEQSAALGGSCARRYSRSIRAVNGQIGSADSCAQITTCPDGGLVEIRTCQAAAGRRHHDGMRRVVILGRGGAGKSVLARQLSDVTGIPAVELDALFWQPGPTPMDPSRWAACQHELVQRGCWILDGDLGPYDTALEVRLRAADTIVVLDFTFLRCAWRTLRRGREQAEYWHWVRAYRRRSLPDVMRAISSEASRAKLYVLRNPTMVQRFVNETRQAAAQERGSG